MRISSVRIGLGSQRDIFPPLAAFNHHCRRLSTVDFRLPDQATSSTADPVSQYSMEKPLPDIDKIIWNPPEIIGVFLKPPDRPEPSRGTLIILRAQMALGAVFDYDEK